MAVTVSLRFSRQLKWHMAYGGAGFASIKEIWSERRALGP